MRAFVNKRHRFFYGPDALPVTVNLLNVTQLSVVTVVRSTL